MLAFLLVK